MARRKEDMEASIDSQETYNPDSRGDLLPLHPISDSNSLSEQPFRAIGRLNTLALPRSDQVALFGVTRRALVIRTMGPTHLSS